LIVGGGDELEKLTANVATKSWRKSVELTGAVSTESIPGLLASMDVGVAPYPKLERFYFSPLKIYEYMAAGLPVVASRLGQIEQVIEHGRNGLLCAPGDASDLSHALIRLRSDPRLRAKLGSNARATVLARHTWDGVVEHILALAALQPSMKGTL
ncbi:MAG: glycosyltransferase family 1 protein, partial [Acidobacteria bacterium]